MLKQDVTPWFFVKRKEPRGKFGHLLNSLWYGSTHNPAGSRAPYFAKNVRTSSAST